MSRQCSDGFLSASLGSPVASMIELRERARVQLRCDSSVAAHKVYLPFHLFKDRSTGSCPDLLYPHIFMTVSLHFLLISCKFTALISAHYPLPPSLSRCKESRFGSNLLSLKSLENWDQFLKCHMITAQTGKTLRQEIKYPHSVCSA